MAFVARRHDARPTSKAKKRKAYEASPAGIAWRAHQHHLASQKRLGESIAMKSVQVTTLNSYSFLPKSSSRASGS